MGNTISYTSTEHTLDLGAKGAIKGLQFDDKARRFAAVPYALPPTGEHRWRRPRPLPPSFRYAGLDGGPYDGTEFRQPCPQGVQIGGKAAPRGNEDCLVVNIWTPVRSPEEPEKKWPVMIWIHGGWFQIGNPSQDNDMDPTELISTGGLNAIVVAIGYRLNIFGFLASHTFLEDARDEVPGNFGLWDQRLAIEWIHENIEAFGGDIHNITLAGRSAGSYSVESQVLHDFRAGKPRASAPFHRIFMSSNAIPAQPKTLAEAEAQFEEVCEHFDIPADLSPDQKLARLRGISQDDLIAAIPSLRHHTFRPVTDDIFFHSGMVDYLRNGAFAHEFLRRGMKILIGEVCNEDTLYAQYNGPKEGNVDELRTEIVNYYGPATTERVLRLYKLPGSSNLDEWKTAFGKIIADGQVLAPTRCLVDSLFNNGVPITDIWRYRIGYRLSFIPESVVPLSYGVCHAMDKSFWNFSIFHGPTPEERKLMEAWIHNLTSFIHGDPTYQFGTKAINEYKTITPDGRITIETDSDYNVLKAAGEAFAFVDVHKDAACNEKLPE